MGLILKDGVQKLLVGYPTVSDKYNVGPAVNEGSHDIYPGDVIMAGSKSGAYVGPADGTLGTDLVVGFAIATNVNVPNTYPAAPGPVPFQPGMPFGLMTSGYIAVELDANATLANISEGVSVYINTSSGKCTDNNSGTLSTVCTFTGITELQGTTKVAEIYVPPMAIEA